MGALQITQIVTLHPTPGTSKNKAMDVQTKQMAMIFWQKLVQNTASPGSMKKQGIHSTLLSHGSLTIWPKRSFLQRRNCRGASIILLDTLLPSFCWLVLLVPLLLDITPLLESVLWQQLPPTARVSSNMSSVEHK